MQVIPLSAQYAVWGKSKTDFSIQPTMSVKRRYKVYLKPSVDVGIITRFNK